MNDNQNLTSPVVWTKEQCIEIVKKCETKEEVQERYPDAYDTIKSNTWFYLYSSNYLGKDPQPSTEKPPKVKEAPAPAESNPLKLKATNKIKAPAKPEPPKPKRKKPIAKVTNL